MNGRCQTHFKALKSSLGQIFCQRAQTWPYPWEGAAGSELPQAGLALIPAQSSTGNLCCTPLKQHQHMDAAFHSQRHHEVFSSFIFPTFPCRSVTFLLQSRININPTNCAGIKAELESSQAASSGISLGVWCFLNFLDSFILHEQRGPQLPNFLSHRTQLHHLDFPDVDQAGQLVFPAEPYLQADFWFPTNRSTRRDAVLGYSIPLSPPNGGTQ